MFARALRVASSQTAKNFSTSSQVRPAIFLQRSAIFFRIDIIIYVIKVTYVHTETNSIEMKNLSSM